MLLEDAKSLLHIERRLVKLICNCCVSFTYIVC